jgi:carnitine 3-dehydrogenase
MNWKPSASPEDKLQITCVGAGTIGSGWAAHFLARGHDVSIWDPAQNSKERAQGLISAAWPSLTELGLDAGADRTRLKFSGTLAEALADADYIQESAFEDLSTKQDLFALIDEHAAAGAVIGSSTSCLDMNDIAATSQNQDRMLVAHPFNPPYLVPLVEIVAGKRTSKQALDWLVAFMKSNAKAPVVLHKYVEGFIANRFQEAIWRETLNLLDEGVATAEDLDIALIEGPALRWPLLGQLLTYQLGGGAGGIENYIELCKESFQSQGLGRFAAPMITDEMKATLSAAAQNQAAGLSQDELIKKRDAFLVSTLRERKRLADKS